MFYKKLLMDAGKRVWQQKSLWMFGLLTALVSTGGVFDVLARSAQRVQRGPKFLQSVLDGSFAGYDLFIQYVSQLKHLDPTRVTITSAILIIVFIILLVAAVVAQGALIQQLLSKKPLAIWDSVRKGSSDFFRLLSIDILTKASTLLLVFLMTAMLITLMSQTNEWNFVLYAVLFLLFFPAILVINIISIFAQINTVREKTHVLDAIHAGTNIFRKNIMVALELGLILFLVIFLAWTLGAVFVLILSIPYTLISALALLSTNLVLFSLTNLLGVIFFTGMIFAIVGATVAYEYAAWVDLYTRANSPRPLKAVLRALRFFNRR